MNLNGQNKHGIAKAKLYKFIAVDNGWIYFAGFSPALVSEIGLLIAIALVIIFVLKPFAQPTSIRTKDINPPYKLQKLGEIKDEQKLAYSLGESFQTVLLSETEYLSIRYKQLSKEVGVGDTTPVTYKYTISLNKINSSETKLLYDGELINCLGNNKYWMVFTVLMEQNVLVQFILLAHLQVIISLRLNRFQFMETMSGRIFQKMWQKSLYVLRNLVFQLPLSRVKAIVQRAQY